MALKSAELSLCLHKEGLSHTRVGDKWSVRKYILLKIKDQQMRFLNFSVVQWVICSISSS